MKRFKVTTINGSAFHFTILLIGIGVLGGLGLILSASGFFATLFASGAVSLRYAFMILFECSLFYSAGLLIGLDKATDKIKKCLRKG